MPLVGSKCALYLHHVISACVCVQRRVWCMYICMHMFAKKRDSLVYICMRTYAKMRDSFQWCISACICMQRRVRCMYICMHMCAKKCDSLVYFCVRALAQTYFAYICVHMRAKMHGSFQWRTLAKTYLVYICVHLHPKMRVVFVCVRMCAITCTFSPWEFPFNCFCFFGPPGIHVHVSKHQDTWGVHLHACIRVQRRMIVHLHACVRENA